MTEAIKTRPPTTHETKLKEKYAESIAAQSDLMDKLAQQLLTLELAIPGLYATVLKLISGDKATLPVNARLSAAFGLWLLALVLTLIALIPKAYTVDPALLERDPQAKDKALGIKDFFTQSARYKRNFLLPAAALFFLGIVCAAMTVF